MIVSLLMGTLAAASSVGLVLTPAVYRVAELLVILTTVGECEGRVTLADEGLNH